MATPYVTRELLEQMSIGGSALSDLPDSDVAAAIDSASSRVDSYLTGRFKLPLSEWGADIEQATADIAAYLAIRRRGLSPTGDDGIRQGYEDAISWLKDVAAGRAVPSNVDITDAHGAAAEADSPAVVSHMVLSAHTRDSFYEKGETEDGITFVGTPRHRGF